MDFWFVLIITYGHSHAALLVELGYTSVAVAERLGDTVEVAMSTCSHLYPDKMDVMATDLERWKKGEGTGPSSAGAGEASLEDVANRLETAEKQAQKQKCNDSATVYKEHPQS